MTPVEIIARNLAGMTRPMSRYPSTLQPKLRPRYCYPIDAGHSILVILRDNYRPGMEMSEAADYMVPAPVKTVLRGYSIFQDMVVIAVPRMQESENPSPPYYSSLLGLVCPDEDSEFGTHTSTEQPGGFAEVKRLNRCKVAT